MSRIRRKIVQLHKVYRQKRDDRGSAIVIVIIAMAMIGVLATTLLWMAYMNYMLKVADIRNKNSFYSAEKVMEQIMAGLQQESAEAAGAAYRDVMAGWEGLETANNRYHVFAVTYMDALIEKLKDDSYDPYASGLHDARYDREKLKAYVDTVVFNGSGSAANEGVDTTAWDNGGPAGAGKLPLMEIVNNNSIVLHDVYVSYTDSENRVSIVQTDICIDVPKLIFENNGSIDGLYEYSLIGNSGIEVSGAGGTAAVEGSVYAGTDASDKGGLVVRPANNLILNDSRRVITKGDIVVEGPSAGLMVRDMPGEDNRVYARNITLEGGMVSLDSKVYVADDLTLEGPGSRATLSKEYYGYGVETYNGINGPVNSAASSAIIINGKNSTLDMTGVDRLLIAGRAYIGQSSTRTEEENYQAKLEAGFPPREQPPVMMGESIAVKGNQIAYLVPPECIGTRGGETLIGQNPINGDKQNDIDAMLRENLDGTGSGDAFETAGGASAAVGDTSESAGTQGTFCEVDFSKKVYRLGNKSLSEFGVTDMNHIRKVNVQYHGGTLRYYYLVLDKEQAERYFVQYYNINANKESIDRYFDKYVSGGILLGDFETPGNQYTILGNSLVGGAVADSGVSLLASKNALTHDGESDGTGTPDGEDTQGENPPLDLGVYLETGENAEEVTNTKDEAAVTALSADIASTYRALTFNLTEDPSMLPADPDASYCVFNNVVKENQIDTYLNTIHEDKVIYETESGLRAVLLRNLSNPAKVSEVDTTDHKLRLLISMGDVIVDRDFSGLIVAKGKVTIDPSAVSSVKLNKMDLYKVLEAKNINDSTDSIKPIDMFVNGGGSMANGAETPEVDGAGNLVIDYSEIVRYRNWIKK